MSDLISVLYVEDEEHLLTAGREFLSRSGDFVVTGASTAEEAIDILKNRKFDAIISDFQMPGMDGIQFLKYLKEKGDPTPFILFTGKSREDVVIEALNNGAAFYLQKGTSPVAVFTELENKVRSAVSHSRAVEELKQKNEEIKGQYAALQRSENNLRDTTDLLENLIHIAQAPIIIWDPSFHIIRLNYACEILIGRRSEEIIGSPIENLFSPDEADRMIRLFQAIRDGGRWEKTELNLRHNDGTVRNILWNTSTLYRPDGITPIATIAQGNDITDEFRLKREKSSALEQIQKNLAQLAILNDEIRNPLMIICTCADLLGTGELVDQILSQTRRIDEMVGNLDRRWIESEKVLRAIKKHYQIEPAETSALTEETGPDHINIPEHTPPLIEEIKARLFTILDSIDALVYVADMDAYELLYTNRQGRAMLGNILGQRCYQALHPGLEKPCTFCKNSNLLTSEGEPTGIHRWELQNDEDGRWYDCRDRAIRWSDGRLVHLTISTDITERRESEARFRSYIENAPEGVFLADGKGNYFFVNDAATKTTGYSREELLEKNLIDLIYPEDIPQAGEHFQKLIETGSTVGEVRFVTKQGEIRWWTVKAVRLSPEEFLGFTNDITEKKRAEEALITSGQTFQAIVQSIPSGIFTYKFEEPDRLILLGGNREGERLTGLKIEDWIGKEFNEIWPAARESGITDAYLTAYRTGVLFETDSLYYQDSLLSGAFRVHAFPIPGNRLVVALENITERKLFEEELIEFRTAVMQSVDGIALTDMTGNVRFVNKAFAEMHGYSPEEVIGRHIRIFHTEEQEEGEVKSFMDRLLTSGLSSEGELWHVHRDGTEFPTYMTTSILKNADNKPFGLIGIARDTTERKKVEKALNQSRELLQAVIDHSQYLIYAKDLQGRFILASQSLAEFFGQQRDQLLGKTSHDFLPKESADQHWANDQEVMANKNLLQIEETVITPDGLLTFLTTKFPLFDSNGTIYAVCGASIDITGRKELEESLRQSEERLRETSRIARVGGWEIDLVGNTLLWTEETFRIHELETDHSPDVAQAIGFYHPDDQSTVNSEVQSAIENGCDFDLEARLITAKKNLRWVRAVGKAVFSNGRAVRIQGMIQDITDRRLVEEELRESEEKYRSLFDNAILGIYRTTPEGQYLDMNPAFARIAGYNSPAEMMAEIHDIGKQLYARPDDRLRIGELLKRDGEIRNFETEIHHREGHSIWISVNSTAARNEDGSIKYWEGTIEEITARKLAEAEIVRKNETLVAAYEEEAAIREELSKSYEELTKSQEFLRESEERLILAHKATNDVVWDWDVHSDTQQWSEAGTKVFGWTEIVERPVNAQWWVDRVHPDDRNRIHDSFFAVVEDPTADFWSGEYRFLKIDGTYADVMDKGYVLRNEQRKAYRMIGAMLDITERKRAEAQIRASDERLRLAIHASSIMVFSQDLNLRYTWIYNKKTVFSLEHIIGKTDAEILPQKEADILTAMKLQVLKSGKGTRQYVQMTIAGRTVDYDLTVEPLQDSSGTISGVICAALDITDLKQKEEALLSSNQKLHLLTSLTRHDINNTLTAIHLLQTMASEESDPEKKNNYILTALKAVIAAESIIQFTKEYEDFGIVASRWQEVRSLIGDAMADTVHTGIIIEIPIPPDIQVFADPIIRKVFSTLIENAVRHAGPLTRIQFSCLKAEPHIIIVYEDDGIGIPRDEKEKLFDHGYGKNTGIGLFIAREILAITGLSITETGEPGKGARFEILVPDGKWRREYTD